MLCKVEVPVMHSNTGALLPGQVLDKGTIQQIKERSEFEIGPKEGAPPSSGPLFC